MSNVLRRRTVPLASPEEAIGM